MPFFVYVVVLITALFSVFLEWDALVEPSAAARHGMQAASSFSPPPPQVLRSDVKQDDGVVQPAPGDKAAAAPQAVAPVKAAGEPHAVTLDDTLVQKTAAPAAPLCDVAACAAAYHSFRESDCTYMPSAGVRRLCTKGNPPQ
jgi:hypothetical protein